MSPLLIPAAWLPEAAVHRVILHWTAGRHQPSFIDRLHYHLLIDAAGTLHRGQFPIGRWPPHTRRLNTGSVGIALCGMLGAREAPFAWGAAPLTAAQITALAPAAAQVLARYGLPVTEATCLTHCEVTTAYGIVQRGKWDISVLPGMRAPAPHSTGEHLRQLVRLHWRAAKGGGRGLGVTVAGRRAATRRPAGVPPMTGRHLLRRPHGNGSIQRIQ